MKKWTLLSSGVMLAWSGVAAAQSSDSTAPAPLSAPGKAPAEVSAVGLGDIIVTAQRRDESLQSVPLSVQAFSATQLQNKGATSLNDLPNLVPGVSIFLSGPSPRVYIRGVGNANYSSGGGTVVTMIDGVYQPFVSGIPQFVGISGIEVDKGPQGTLFGRNATGGAIQITTRSPDREPTFEAHAGYANYDTISADAYAATALSDNVRANVSGYFSQRRKGWGVNLTTGKEVFLDKQYGARTRWDIDVSDATSIQIIADYTYSKFDAGSSTSPDPAYPVVYNFATRSRITVPGTYNTVQGFDPGNKARQGGVSAKIESEISDGITLTSTSLWRKLKSSQFSDADGVAGQLNDASIFYSREGLSEELQLASDKAARLNWVAGLFYYHEESNIDEQLAGIVAGALGSPPGQPNVTLGLESTDTIALYGQASYALFPRTTLTLGGRYTEDKRITSGVVRLGGPGAPIDPNRTGEQAKNFRKFTYRVAVDHKITDDVLVYASTSTGFNAGGFAAINPGGYKAAQNPRFEPEEITAYEVGLKTSFLDNRVRANVAAFWYDYANLQQSVFNGISVQIVNAGKARMKGIDFELSARPVRNLTISLNGEYLDAKYRSYPRAPAYELGPLGQLILYTLGDRNGGIGAAGKRVIYAPTWSLNPDITYVIPTEIGEFSTSANLQWRTKSYVDPENTYFIRSLSIINLSERWTSPDAKTDVRLWVNNLTNEAYSQSIKFVTPFGPKADFAPPRTYGITIGRKF